MHKEIVAKILHDLASPLTALSLLSHSNNDIQTATDDMVWRLKCLRLIFVKEKLSHADIAPFIKNINSNTHEDKYNRLFIILAYLFKNIPLSSRTEGEAIQPQSSPGLLRYTRNDEIKIENNILTIPHFLSKDDLEILTNDHVKTNASNVLLKLLKEESNYLNIKIQVV